VHVIGMGGDVRGLDPHVKGRDRGLATRQIDEHGEQTALQDGEIVTGVRFPKVAQANYQKFRNPASRYAIVGVFVAKTGSGTRVAVTGAGPSVFRQKEMEAALAKSFTPDAVANVKVPASGLNGDIHASPEYRAHLVTVMAKRAVAAAK